MTRLRASSLALLACLVLHSAARAEEPQPDDEYELSAAELANLGLTDENGEAQAVDTAIKLYGFIDFSTVFVLASHTWREIIQEHPSFYIGNFNLYLSKNINQSVRTFAEVRLMYLPNGSRSQTTLTGDWTSTVAYDYADFDRALKWGGIEIERVYLEWTIHSLLSLRVGQFLTPYGIWNVDHGSPTIIPVIRPFIIGNQLFPERQTGFELFGQLRLSSDHTLGYHLTLSNGFGPVSEYRDLDDNKAVGGRLYWTYEGLGELRIGVSGFFGSDTDARRVVRVDSNALPTFTERIEQQSDVLALAGDLRWQLGGALLQAEVITQQRHYTDGRRAIFTHPLLGRPVALPDTFSWGGYVLAGYRFEWLGSMPFAMLSHVNFIEPFELTRAKPVVVDVGLNVRPIDEVVIKVDYQHAFWPGGYFLTDVPMQVLSFQLAWAF
ncbi:MAG TPA: hypothetical protein VJR89_30360 [Polyangiales bacterium]|nr:hypothetical protein [Polyangiales bacterium]